MLVVVVFPPGILHVSAVDLGDSSNSSHITISNDKSRLSQAEIASMLLMSELFAAEDSEQEQTICAQHSLQAYAAVVRATLQGPEAVAKLDENERAQVAKAVDAAEAWLAANPVGAAAAATGETDDDAAPASLSAADFQSQQTALESVCQPSLKKLFAADPAAAGGKDAPEGFQSLLGDALAKMQLEAHADRLQAKA